jgi:hypothetical protein
MLKLTLFKLRKNILSASTIIITIQRTRGSVEDPVYSHTTTSNIGTMSELIVLIAGMVIGLAVDRLLKTAASKAMCRIGKKPGISQLEVNENSPLVRATRRFARWIPSSCWQGLTWSLFLAEYVYKSLSTWTNTAIYIGYCMVLKYVSPTLKLILDTAWYGSTIHQAANMCKQDHENYLAFGKGGTPQTWNGFKRITLLEWFGKIDTLEAPNHRLGVGYLDKLEQRPGQRPKVVGIAPQRQLDQRAPEHVYDYLLTFLDHLSAENASRIRTATSFLEQRTEALLADSDCVTNPIFRTFGCEIAHPHKIDGSLHCMLHPADIETVINAGWGERHSIARADSWWMWWFFAFEGRPPIPEHLCFIYAPRTEYEVCVVSKIVEAGITYVVGPELKQHTEWMC